MCVDSCISSPLQVTDFIAARTFTGNSCISQSTQYVDGVDATTRTRTFITVMVALLWISTAVGVVFSVYTLWYTGSRLVRHRMLFDTIRAEQINTLSTPGLHWEKGLKFIHLTCEDVVQIVCNILISVYITGWCVRVCCQRRGLRSCAPAPWPSPRRTTVTVVKLCISILNIALGMSRVMTFVWPWGHMQARVQKRTLTRTQLVVRGLFFGVVALALLAPLWVTSSQYFIAADIAHDAQYSSDNRDVSPLASALSDATAGLQEPVPIAMDLSLRACIPDQQLSTNQMCSPSWNARRSTGLMNGAKPWDVISCEAARETAPALSPLHRRRSYPTADQILYRDASYWRNYSTPLPASASSGYAAPSPSILFIIALRRRLTIWQVTVLSPLTGRKRGLSFLTKPPYELALTERGESGSDDLLSPASFTRRVTMELPACTAPCRETLTFTPAMLNRTGLVGLNTLYLFINSTVFSRCENE